MEMAVAVADARHVLAACVGNVGSVKSVAIRGKPFAVNPSRASRLGCSRAAAVAGNWKQVIDPSSGKPYYWDPETNETRWDLPKEGAAQSSSSGTDPQATSSPLSEEELTEILLAADTDKFGDTANNYRPQCFELSYFDYLTRRIEAAQDPETRLSLEKLRARLSNPLLKNPPPY